MISKALDHQRVGSILNHLNNGVIEGILILLQPIGQIVRYCGSIMDNSKMRIRIRPWVRLCKVRPFSQKVSMQLLIESEVRCLREERLLLKDSQQSHRLLKHVNTFLQIHTKINIGPVQTFPNILLLFKSEHVGVEELLQLFIDVVDTDLFKAIIVKYLKTSNIQYTDVLNLLHGWVRKCFITLFNHKSE